jgi:hypothetical protein
MWVDRCAVRLADLDVDPGLLVLGGAGVAGIADQLPGDDVRPGSDARSVAPRAYCQAVVGRRRIIVEVVEVVFVSLGVADHDSDPSAGVIDEAQDHAVDGRDDRLKLCCENVGAAVEARAALLAFHPVVVERCVPDYWERDRQLFPGVG